MHSSIERQNYLKYLRTWRGRNSRCYSTADDFRLNHNEWSNIKIPEKLLSSTHYTNANWIMSPRIFFLKWECNNLKPAKRNQNMVLIVRVLKTRLWASRSMMQNYTCKRSSTVSARNKSSQLNENKIMGLIHVIPTKFQVQVMQCICDLKKQLSTFE